MRRIHFDVTDSTNTQARVLAAAHSGERFLVTAAEQTAGRGRRGRQWRSPRGGAWMSLVWPMQLPVAAYGAASLAAAVGVRRGVVDVASRGVPLAAASGIGAGGWTDFLIKWPNDLLIDDAKVAGILCEQSMGGAVAANWLIIGVGVNVAFDQQLLIAGTNGEAMRHPATTLSAALGRHVEIDEVTEQVGQRVVEAMERLETEGLAGQGDPSSDQSLLAELRRCLAYVGRTRRWSSPRGDVNGRVLGIDDAGRLMLETAAGVMACEVGELMANHDDLPPAGHAEAARR